MRQDGDQTKPFNQAKVDVENKKRIINMEAPNLPDLICLLPSVPPRGSCFPCWGVKGDGMPLVSLVSGGNI